MDFIFQLETGWQDPCKGKSGKVDSPFTKRERIPFFHENQHEAAALNPRKKEGGSRRKNSFHRNCRMPKIKSITILSKNRKNSLFQLFYIFTENVTTTQPIIIKNAVIYFLKLSSCHFVIFSLFFIVKKLSVC